MTVKNRGRTMAVFNKLKIIMDKHKGIITTNIAEKNNIHREYLNILAKRGALKRVSYGVYANPDVWEDFLFIKQIKRDKMTYSHETALFLHDLTDRDPVKYVVTVPQGYNTTRLKKEGLIVHSVKKEWFELGVESKKTTFGNEVRIYNMERTICDILRDRNKQDPAVVNDSLRKYVHRKEKDLNKLIKYADVLRIEKILRNYLEVLL